MKFNSEQIVTSYKTTIKSMDIPITAEVEDLEKVVLEVKFMEKKLNIYFSKKNPAYVRFEISLRSVEGCAKEKIYYAITKGSNSLPGALTIVLDCANNSLSLERRFFTNTTEITKSYIERWLSGLVEQSEKSSHLFNELT